MKQNKSILTLVVLGVLAIPAYYFYLIPGNPTPAPEPPQLAVPDNESLPAAEAPPTGVDMTTGLAALDAGRIGEAEAAMVAAVSVNPEVAESRIALASVFAASDRPQQAVDELHEAFRIDSGSIDSVLADPRFEELRYNPQFINLLLMHDRDIPEMYENPNMPPGTFSEAATYPATDELNQEQPTEAADLEQ